MSAVLFTNVRVFDGTGSDSFAGEVLVQGNRIKKVARGTQPDRPRARRRAAIDGHGMTLMPGMVEGHCHPSFTGVVDALPARHDPARGAHAQDRGQRQAAARERLHQHLLRRLGQAPARRGGPQRDQRRRAPGPAHARRQPRDGRDRRARRRAPAASAPRELRADRRRPGGDPARGADLHPRGRRQHQAQHLGRRLLPARAGRRARPTRTKKSRWPARSPTSSASRSRLALALGQQRQALGPQRRRLHLPLRVRRRGGARHDGGGQGPDLPRPGRRPAAQHGLRGRALGHHPRGGRAAWACAATSSSTAEVYAEVKKRGIRVVIGGDYGFAWTPQGTNARDLQHFVNLFGYTPMEALRLRHPVWRRADAHGRRARARSARAISPTCCWSTATRCRTSPSWPTATGSP